MIAPKTANVKKQLPRMNVPMYKVVTNYLYKVALEEVFPSIPVNL